MGTGAQFGATLSVAFRWGASGVVLHLFRVILLSFFLFFSAFSVPLDCLYLKPLLLPFSFRFSSPSPFWGGDSEGPRGGLNPDNASFFFGFYSSLFFFFPFSLQFILKFSFISMTSTHRFIPFSDSPPHHHCPIPTGSE